MKVMVAMSGGVDSSVAAGLLAADGHDVVGVTMRLWGGESDTGCCSVSDVDDARRAADALGIEHLVFNFGDDFSANVVTPYVSAHRAGITPNPCIECNRKVKFARLADRAIELGFDAVATGHHARIGRRGDQFTLERGADRTKDQSYVVHMLDQDGLARTLFPIGSLTKDAVRRRAGALGLRTATKPDSQDVCFITTTGGRQRFLGRRIPFTPARVVDSGGSPVGTVPAIELVTVGQRKGLGMAGGGPKRYVLAVDRAAATVVVGDEHELLDDGLDVAMPTWVAGPVDGDVLAQTSAHGTPHRALVRQVDRGLRLDWHEPQRRVAPGQSVVFYDLDDRCVHGGGIAAQRDGGGIAAQRDGGGIAA
jgi:tRNA-uridine 2-sulfurtransferase